MLKLSGNGIAIIILLPLFTACKSLFITNSTQEPLVYVCQGEQEIPVTEVQSVVNIGAGEISIRFFNQPYDTESGRFNAMRIAAILDVSQIPPIRSGMPVDSVPCFRPGTGMACARSGRYNALIFNPNAHHYLYYENEESKRLRCLGAVREQLKLEFTVDSLSIWRQTESLTQTSVDEFYLVFFNDKNLNKLIDDGEWGQLTIRIKDNYRGWKESYWNKQDSVGQTPLHRLFQFQKWGNSNERQRLAIVEDVCSLPDVDLNIRDAFGNTALHYALASHYVQDEKNDRGIVKWNNIQLIRCLVEQGNCEVNLANNYYANTPLQEYLMKYETGVNKISPRGLELIRFFVEHTDLQLKHENNIGYTAYDYAERKNWLDDENNELIEQLKPKAGYNAGATHELWKMIKQVDFNASAEDSAFFVQNIQLCIDHNANLISRKFASSPLSALCDTRHRPYGYDDSEIASNLQLRAILLKQLIEVPTCNVNAHDGEGLTALHHAAKNQSPALVKVLVDNEATDLNVQNTAGNTSLMDVVQNLRFRMDDEGTTIECLRILSSDVQRINLHLVNYQGQSLADLLNRRLYQDENHERYASLYPELYQCLDDINKRLYKK